MSLSPLGTACTHVASAEEQQRDPAYLFCDAQAGQPCRWANRHDGFANPSFHSDRLETAFRSNPGIPEDLTQALFSTGLV